MHEYITAINAYTHHMADLDLVLMMLIKIIACKA